METNWEYFTVAVRNCGDDKIFSEKTEGTF